MTITFFLLVTFPESIDINKSFLLIGIIIEGLILINSDTQEIDKVIVIILSSLFLSCKLVCMNNAKVGYYL